jgi:hypothetical protein
MKDKTITMSHKVSEASILLAPQFLLVIVTKQYTKTGSAHI